MHRKTNNESAICEKTIRKHIVNKKLKNIKIVSYDMTDSTNTRAREYAKADSTQFPAVFIANGQHAGRGRRGRIFDSASGCGLYISFLFRPMDKVSDSAALTARAAVKICRAIESVCTLSVGIKWVNDVFVNGRKLAGILTEGEFDAESGKFSYMICGIGINLNKRKFPKEISDIATTVEDETGNQPDRNLLAARIIEEFFAEDAEPFIDEYRRRSSVIGKRVEVRRISGEIFTAFVIGITDGCRLLIKTDDGLFEELISAEVSIKQTINNC